jgi:hypothetical protein
VAVDQRLFDQIVRKDGSPARYSEDSFTFLNRAAGSFWARIRDELETWFAAYPADHQADLRARFRSRLPSQHWAAWWELYLHRLFSALGFHVEVHPDLPGSGARPDFRLTREAVIYLEAVTSFSGIVEEGRSGVREAWILDAVNEAKSDDFFLGLNFETVGQQRPRVVEVTGPIEEWLRDLDPDVAAGVYESTRELPTRLLAIRDWKLKFRAIPKSPAGRGKPGRLLGIGPMSVGFTNDREKLGKSLERKRRRYGKPGAPLILALLSMSSGADEIAVAEALFGSEVVRFDPDNPDDSQLARTPDGLWTKPGGPRATRVSGVLVGTTLLPWTCAARWPRLWLNPWATHPLKTELPFSTVWVDDHGVLTPRHAGSTPSAVLGLPSDWPGPAPRFSD